MAAKEEADRKAAEKAEADRKAAEKAEADRKAAEKAEADRKAEEERLANITYTFTKGKGYCRQSDGSSFGETDYHQYPEVGFWEESAVSL